MIPWGAVIQAGATGLASWLGREKKPKNPIQDVVRDAKAAGIHPLAALGSNLSGAYGSPVSSAAGSAVGAGLDRFAASLANQKSEAELDALKSASEHSRAEAELARARSRSIIQGAQNGGRAPASYGSMLKYAGKEWQTAPDTSDTQKIEDRYGDLVGAGYGVTVGVRDMAYAAKSKWRKQFFDKPQNYVDWRTLSP